MAEPKAFVCGFPIAHSRSPLIHGHWLKELGLVGSYERVAVEPENFPAFITSLRANGYVGGNVTIPHKEAAFALVAERDAAATAIGAVNTLWFEDDALCGGNTDAYGFAANLDASAPGWANCDKAVVLGAGGASRAIIHALLERGIPSVHVVNRTLSRAEELVRHFGPRIHAHDFGAADTLLDGAGLLVNTTSLGMKGSDGPRLDLDRLPDAAVVADIVYVPLETPLLKQAKARGLRTVDGLGMLLHQAVPGFARWFGARPAVTPELRRIVLADVERAA